MSEAEPGPALPPRPHAVSAAMFDRIADGLGGAEGARLLVDAEYSRRLMSLWAVRRAAAEHGGEVEARAREAWDLLAAAQRCAPDATRALIMYPSVGPVLLRTLHALTRSVGHAPGSCAAAHATPYAPSHAPPHGALAHDPGHGLTVLAAAAVASVGLPGRISVPLYGRRIVLPGVGGARLPQPADGARAVVEGGPDGARVTVGGRVAGLRVEDGWRRPRMLLPSAAPGGGLVLDDVDPDSAPVSGRCGRLRGAVWQRWRQVTAAGWEVLRAEHPEVAAEAEVVLRALVPLSAPPTGRRSGSSKETFGAAALTRPARADDLALTVAHELQHNKLSALLHLFELTAERPGELFYAPWRADPRPLVGLLHGAYAHLGVARFWHRRLATGRQGTDRHAAQVQFARWRGGAAEAVGALLASRRLTGLGVRFVTRMSDALEGLAHTPVSAAAAAESAAAAEAHRRSWHDRHGTVLRFG